ncbi:MAG: hypothetical protein KGQ66_15395 [Acidobacteriota bacterium]|nr:hypothetical protein [Acidobacteriota bacterium]
MIAVLAPMLPLRHAVPAATAGAAGAFEAGNLVVSVPYVPASASLVPLCRALLTFEQGGPGAAQAAVELQQPQGAANAPGISFDGLALLEGATGGSEQSAAAWCALFLAHPPRG